MDRPRHPQAPSSDDAHAPTFAVGSAGDATPKRLARSGDSDPLARTAAENPALDATLASGSGGSTVGTAGGASQPNPAAALGVGDVLAARYRIVRQLGRGGMGEVYEAEDLELADRVALKTLRAGLGADSKALARFKQEIRLARKVTHPNVCRLFEFGQHRLADGRDIAFLTMELLEGRTLAERLHQERMTTAAALPIVEQIAAGLAAAHAAGIVHRDLKSSNVFLVGERALVTDFGIARQPDLESSMTEEGSWVGSPAYIAPEQVSGKDVTGAADIFAFGVVMFEMVTGRLPFVAETPLGTALMRLDTPAPSPRTLVPTLDPRWESVILRCLERDPAKRFGSAAEVAAALQAPRVVPRRSRRMLLAIVGAVMLAGAAGGFVVHRAAASSSHQSSPQSISRRSVVVVDLANQSARKEQAWIGTALGEVLIADLRAGGALWVTPAADVARMNAELRLDSGGWSNERLSAIRTDVGADLVVTGSFLALGETGQIRVEVVVYDTVTSKQRSRVSETGTEADLIGLGSRLTAAIRRELGLDAVPEALTVGNATLLPSRASAAKLYAEGLAKLRRFEIVEARDLLVRAAADEPEYPLIHSALAAAWAELGYDAKAAAEAKLAFDHLTTLPKEHQLAVTAQYHEAIAEWDQAAAAYRTLLEFYPERLDYGLALARVRTRAGDAKTAYATLDALRKLPAPLGNDPRIDLAEAMAAEVADDFERNHVAAGRAIASARQRNARQLLAKALLHDGWTLWTRGRDREASAAYEEARRLFADIGDRSGLAFVMNNIALAFHRTHQDGEATKTFAEALAIAKDIGDTVVQAHLLNNWAYVLTDQGNLARASELVTEQLELLGRRGVGPNHLALVHFNLAEVTRWRGDLAGARKHGTTAEDLLRGLDSRRYAAWAAYQLGEVLHVEGDLAGARTRLEQALGWASSVTMPAESAELRTSLARIAIDETRYDDADILARQACSDLRSAKESSQLVCAEAVLASALLARGRLADAATELATIASLPSDGVSFACRLEAEVVGARVAATDRAKAPAAIETLQRARDRAEQAGFVQMQLQIRLALGAVRIAGGDAAAGRAELKTLVRDATAKGFKLVARQAATALGGR